MKYAAALLVCLMGGVCLFGARPEIVEGNPASPVKVFVYEDLQCGDCRNFRSLLDGRILPRYGTRVAFVHRDLPLPKHDWARQAAVAARWVYEVSSEAGVVFRREIMAEQDHLTTWNLKGWLQEFARRNKLSEQGIVAALSDARLLRLVDQDYMAAVARGVTRTPTVYVGNQSFVETIVYEDLARALDVELGK